MLYLRRLMSPVFALLLVGPTLRCLPTANASFNKVRISDHPSFLRNRDLQDSPCDNVDEELLEILVLVEHTGDPFNVSSDAEREALQDAFVTSYNQAAEDSCGDNGFRTVENVIIDTTVSSGLNVGENATTVVTRQSDEVRVQFTYLYRVSLRCVGCRSNPRLFRTISIGDASTRQLELQDTNKDDAEHSAVPKRGVKGYKPERSLLLLTKKTREDDPKADMNKLRKQVTKSKNKLTIEDENEFVVSARQDDSCQCVAPFAQVFLETFNVVIDGLVTFGVLTSVDSADAVFELEAVDCGPETTFESFVEVTHTGDADAITSSEIGALQDGFRVTYNELNALNGELCDLLFRVLDDVVINQTTTNVTESRQQGNRTRSIFTYIYLSTGRCRGCGTRSNLFNEAVALRRSLKEEPALRQESRFLQNNTLNDTCFCPIDAELRAPDEVEFQQSFEETIRVLRETGVIQNVDPILIVEDLVEPPQVPTAMVTPAPSRFITPSPTPLVTPPPTVSSTPPPTVLVTPRPTILATPPPTILVTPPPTLLVSPPPTTLTTPPPTLVVSPPPTTLTTPQPTTKGTLLPTRLETPSPSPSPSRDPTFPTTPAPTTIQEPTVTTSPTTVSPSSGPPTVDSIWRPLGQSINGTSSDDFLGSSVSLSRNAGVMAVGAGQFQTGAPGFVSVSQFDDLSQRWSQIASNLIGEVSNDGFGAATSLNGDGTIVAVGTTAGYVRVHEYNGGVAWVPIGNDIAGPAGASFGLALSLSDSGNRIAIGASSDDTSNGSSSGSVSIYEYNSATASWELLGDKIIGEDSGDRFGDSVSLNRLGTIVAVGAPFSNAGRREGGQVSAYEYSGTSWELLGAPINGQQAEIFLGNSVALDDGGFIMAAGPLVGQFSAIVYAYDADIFTWTQRGQPLETGNDASRSVSISGDGSLVATGGEFRSSFQDLGRVDLFQYDVDTGTWTPAVPPLIGDEDNDNFGWEISLSKDGTVIGIGASRRDTNGISNAGATFFLTTEAAVQTPSPTPLPSRAPSIAPTAVPLLPNVPWVPVGQVVNDATMGDRLLSSFSLSRDGSVMAVGAPDEGVFSSQPTSVLVFRFNEADNEWTQLGQTLTAIGVSFGISVSLNGDGTVLAVGAAGGAGYVQVYELNSSESWVARGPTIDGTAGGFGWSVSLADDGDILAVGTNNDDSAGVFEYNNAMEKWDRLGQELFGPMSGAGFGWSVSLNRLGTIVSIGSPFYNSATRPDVGQVSVYEYSGTSWELLGDPIEGPGTGVFGQSVSIDDSGLIMAVGAFDEAFVYIHDRMSSTWSLVGQSFFLSTQPGDDFGCSVSLSRNGNVVAIGASSHNSNGSSDNGQVIILQYNDNLAQAAWEQVGQNLDGEASNDNFGYFVSLSEDGGVVGIGAPFRNSNGAGSAYVFSVNSA